MLLTDVQPYDTEVLHLSISTKTYRWRQLLSNGGNLFIHLIISQIRSFTTFSFWAQILSAFKKKWLQFTCYITDIIRKSHFEMSQEKFKNIHYFKSYSKFKEASNFFFFGNIFVNNVLKDFVLGSINAEFCYLPCYSMKKINC